MEQRVFQKSPLNSYIDEAQADTAALQTAIQARGGLPSPAELESILPAETSDTPQAYSSSPSVQSGLLPPARLRPMFERAAESHGVPLNILMAMAQQESSYNPMARNGDGSSAKGIMQYVDGTARQVGINPYDPSQAIDAAARKIRARLDAGGTMEQAVMGHHAGDGAFGKRAFNASDVDYARSVVNKAAQIGNHLLAELPKPAAEPQTESANYQPRPDLPPVVGMDRAYFKQLQNQYDALDPRQAQQLVASLGDRNDINARALRAIAEQRAKEAATISDLSPMNAIDRTVALATGQGRAVRAAQYAAQGLNPQSADALAQRDAMIGADPMRLGEAKTSGYDFDTRNRFKDSNALTRGVAKGAIGVEKAINGALEYEAELVGLDAAAQHWRNANNQLRRYEEAIGERAGSVERNLEGAVGSITQQLPLLLTGAEGIALAGMAMQSFGQEYSDGRAAGQDAGKAAVRSSLFSALEMVGEKFGLGDQLRAIKAAAKGMPSDQILDFLAKALVKEVPGELLTTTGQFATDKLPAGVGLNTEAGMKEYLGQVSDTVLQTFMQTGLMAGGTTGASKAIRYMQARNPENLSELHAERRAEQARQEALAAWDQGLGYRKPDAPRPARQTGLPVPSEPASQAGSLTRAAQKSPQSDVSALAADLVGPGPVNQEDLSARLDAFRPAEEVEQEPAPQAATSTQELAQENNGVEVAMLPEPDSVKSEPVAEQPQPAEPLKLEEMDEPALRERLKYVAQQARNNGGWNKQFTQERKLIEAEINKRVEQKPTEQTKPQGSGNVEVQQDQKSDQEVKQSNEQTVLQSKQDQLSTQEPALPNDLSGAKPRYSYGKKQFDLTFESDIDKASFIASQKKPSKRDADYVQFVAQHTGMSEQEIRAHGQQVRDSIKSQAKDSEPGTLTISKLYGQQATPQGSSNVEVQQEQKAAKEVKPFQPTHVTPQGNQIAQVGNEWQDAEGTVYEGEKYPIEEGKQPEAVATGSASQQFQSYEKAIKEGQFSAGMGEQIRVDERLEDGEAEKLLAMATTATPAKATPASKEDVEHLFGLDDKRQKALERIANGKAWFNDGVKAKDFVKKNGLADTHEVVKGKGGRWEVAAKAVEPKPADNLQPRSESQAINDFIDGKRDDAPGVEEVSDESWWNGLTPQARREHLARAGIALPEQVTWQHIAGEYKARLLRDRDGIARADALKKIKAEDQKQAATNQPYVNPADPAQTWSGRGRKPQWVEEHLKNGGSLADLRSDAKPKAESVSASETRNPQTLDAFIGDVDAGYRAHFDYAGTYGLTVWIEQTERGWVMKSRDDDSNAIITKGGAGQNVWSKRDALNAAEKAAEYRFKEWKPTTENAPQIIPVVENGNTEQKAEPNFEAAKQLLAEQKAVGLDKKAEANVKRKIRALAKKTPITDNKTVMALDTAATRLNMDGLEFADPVAPTATKQIVPVDDGRKAQKLADMRELGRKAGETGESRTPPEWAGEGELSDAWLEGYGKGMTERKQPAVNSLESRILIAADSIEKLRKVDVERVLMQDNLDRAAMAEYIKSKRPDLAAEVDDVLAEQSAANPAQEPAKPAESDMADLQAQMGEAIGELASILGVKLNMTAEEEAKLIPVMSKILRIAAKMGYIKFKDAAAHVYKQIQKIGGEELAGKLSIDNLQAGYINIAKEIGGDKREALAYDSIDELLADAQSTIEAKNPAQEQGNASKQQQKSGRANESGVEAADRTGVPQADGRRGHDAQQTDAQVHSGNLGAGQSEDVRTLQEGRDGREGGVRDAATDVGDAGSADGGRVSDNGRPRAGGKRNADAGAGGKRGRAGQHDVTAESAPVEKKPETVSPANTGPGDFVIADPLTIVGGGQAARFDKNRAAIELRNRLADEGRQPTREEQEVLAGYTGWGSFGQELFQGTWTSPKPKSGWEARDAWLRDNLGQKEWEGMQRSIINAHYTDPPTVLAMWDMVKRMGFAGGRVLEPSMGIGNFFGMMPADLASRSKRAGIELDPVTGSMAKMLYPEANINIMGYEQSKTPDNFYDVVIGNWPFANYSPADRRYNHLSPMLHDYFFLKALDQTRPGGLVIGITSAGTMDKKDSSVRVELAKKGELVAAFRLPSGAFEDYAGTKVVTDIVILRKRDKPAGIVANEGWIRSTPLATQEGTEVSVNEYYHAHPENVIGTIDFGHGTTTFRHGMIVHRPADMMAQLQRIVSMVPEGAYQKDTRGKQISYITNHTSDRTGALVQTDKGFFVVAGEYLAPAGEVFKYALKSPAKTAEREAQFTKLIEMRKLYGALIEAERAGDASEPRRALKAAYEAFKQAHGEFSESYGLKYLDKIDDPFYPALAALEAYTEDKNGKRTYRPAAILTESTVRGAKKLENPSVADAFVLARNESVNPSPERIAEIAGKPVEVVTRELIASGAAFETPGGDFVPSDIYLSGNVREKMRHAKAGLEAGNQAMQRNIDALKAVIPADVPYYKIETQFGATWVPPKAYAEYIAHMLGLDSTAEIEVGFKAGSWRIDFPSGYNNRAEAYSGFGTKVVRFKRLVRAAIANQTLTIKNKDDNGTVYVDEAATKEANAKIAEMRMKFGEWLWSEPVRRVELEQEYNEVRNAYATPTFDGSFLGFEGMALTLGKGPFNLRMHQVNAIWRALVMRKSLNAHEVGTGKTFTMGGIAVESRRYGIAKKPLLFAHNANSKSVAHEIQTMYPAAKVLYVDNLSKDNVKIRMAQIANDDWDVIVLPHSLIDRIGLKEETLMAMAQKDIDDLMLAAEAAAKEDGVTITPAMLKDEEELKKLRSVTAKQLVKQRQRIIENIKKMAQQASREDSIAFEDIGVDMILVDEAHEFKKPPIATKMKMKGLQTQTSDQSIAMSFIAKYVRGMNNGGNVHLFTGTPITNTMTEVFHMMRYMMGEEMEQAGLADWDGWFGSFAREVEDVELSSTGEYEATTRLQSFINVPELRRMIGQYMDVVFADDMPEMKPRDVNGKKLSDKDLTEAERAQLLNGRTEGAKDRPYKKVVNDSADMAAEQMIVFREVQWYAQAWRRMGKRDRKEAMAWGRKEVPIIHDAIAEKASFDVRLVDAIANAGKEGTPEMEPHPDSKPARAVKNLIEIYRSHKQANQVVFMEQGMHKSASRSEGPPGEKVKRTYPAFSTMYDMIERLVQAGIPREEIAVVTGSTSKDKRKEIADAMNSGKIRIVFGSTDSLGVGVNMQKNLRAMHHMDAPWMPGELEQRNGRGHRQGNQWNTVLEYRYLTDRLDGRRWQVLAIKQRFITEFMKSNGDVRVIEGDAASDEQSDIVSTFSDAAGDPRVLIREKLKKKLDQLQSRERLHAYAQSDAIQTEKRLADRIANMEAELEKFREEGITQSAAKLIEAQRGDGFRAEIGGKKFTKRTEAADFVKKWLPQEMRKGESRQIGSYGGIPLYAEWSAWSTEPDLYLKIGSEHVEANGPSIPSLDGELRRLRDEREAGDENRIAEYRKEMTYAQAVAKEPFHMADKLAEAKKQLEALEADIAMNPVAPPHWLRSGAPIDTQVFWNGKPFLVMGHRWMDNGFFVQGKDDRGSVDMPYLEVQDNQGMPLYEEHEFTPPNVIIKNDANQGPAVLSTTAEHGPVPAGKQLSEHAIAQVIEERIGKFAHQPPIFIKEHASDVLGRAAIDEGAVISGATFGGNIFLFRSGIANRAEAVRTLWHELLHYGLRRFMSREKYIEEMHRLYRGDTWIKRTADEWVNSGDQDAEDAKKQGMDYAIARGVDEALATLAEPNAGNYLSNTLLAKVSRQVMRWVAAVAHRAGYGDIADKYRALTNDEARKLVREIFRKLRDNEAPRLDDDMTRDMSRFTSDSAFRKNKNIGTGLSLPEQSKLQLAQEHIQDSMERVKLLQKRIEAVTGVNIEERNDYYGSETNRPGRIAARLEEGKEKLFKPLVDRLAKSGHTVDQLEELLHAMHAPERYERLKKLGGNEEKSAEELVGLSLEQAAAIRERYAGEDELHAVANKAREITKITMEMRRQYGLITDDAYEALTGDNAYQYYVPLKGSGEYGPRVKRATGHGERDEHILENIFRDYELLVVAGEKNLARQSLLGMALDNPDPDLWTVDVPPKGKSLRQVTAYRVVYLGEIQAEFRTLAEAQAYIEGEAGGTERFSKYSVEDDSGEKVAEYILSLQDNEVPVYIKGKRVRIQIKDEKLAEQIRPLDGKQLNVLFEGMRRLNRWLSSVYTGYNPAFILRNAARDAITGTINMVGNEGAVTAARAWKHYPSALKAMGKWAATKRNPGGDMGRYLQEYRMHGGKTGASYMSDLEEQAKSIQRMYDDAYGAARYAKDGKIGKAGWIAARKSVAGMAHVVEIANQATENAMRLALFTTLRKQGVSPGEAARAAKAVTVNFDRKGKLTPMLGAWWLFFNPAVQGTANGFHTLVHGKHKGHAWAMLGGLAALGVMAAQFGLDDDEDRWLGTSWDERTKNLRMNFGSVTLNIPMSQEFTLFYAFGVAMGEVMHGQSPAKAAVHMASSFLDAYLPLRNFLNPDSDTHDGSSAIGIDSMISMAPTVTQPAWNIVANRNGLGGGMRPDYDDAPDSQKMYRGSKGGVADKLAQGIAESGILAGASKYENDISKVSPETLKYLWRTYTGGLGQFVVDSADLAEMGVTAPGDIEIGGVPIVRDFLKQNRVTPLRSRFYDLKREVDQAKSEFSLATKAADDAELDRLYADDHKTALESLAKWAGNEAKLIKSLRDEAVEINMSPDLTDSQKRAELKKLEQEEEVIYRDAIAVFKETASDFNKKKD